MIEEGYSKCPKCKDFTASVWRIGNERWLACHKCKYKRIIKNGKSSRN